MRLPSSFYTRLKYGSLDAATAAEMLQDALRKLRLDLLLSCLAKLWEELVEDQNLAQEKRQLWPAIQAHQLAYLSMASIRASNDYRGEGPSRDALYHLTNLYNQAQGHEIIARSDEADLADWERFFLRTSYQQFTHQVRLRPEIERSLHLFNVVARHAEIAAVFDIPGEFARAMGLSVEDFMRIGLAVFTLTGGGTGAGKLFETSDLASLMPKPISRSALEQFLGHATGSYTSIREMADTRSPAKPEYEFYRFNPLEALPIVRTDRSGYVVPFPLFVVHRITNSLYYDLMAIDSRRFPGAFGMAFEAYVGELLATVYRDGELFSERVYGGKEEQKSTDWVVVEGTVGTLIECKVARLTMETKVSAEPEALRRDLLKGVVQALKQLDRVMRDIRDGRAGLEPFHDLTDLVPVVMLLDPFFFANVPQIRDLVNHELEAQGITPFDYQVLYVGQIEGDLPLIKRLGLARLLRDKMSENEDIINGAAFVDFDRYLSRVEPERQRERPQFLASMWHALVEQFQTDSAQRTNDEPKKSR